MPSHSFAMRSSPSVNQERRYRQPPLVDQSEENGKLDLFWDTQYYKRSARDAERSKKLEGTIYNTQLGGKDQKQVKLKPNTLKFILLSLLSLTVFITMTFPTALFDSERDLLMAAQQHWNTRLAKQQVAPLFWENLNAKETATLKALAKPERKLGYSHASGKRLSPSEWEELTSLLASYVADDVNGFLKIGLLNFEEEEASEHAWGAVTGGIAPMVFQFEHANSSLTWKHLFPEWIDEEELYEVPRCPTLPMPIVKAGTKLDVILTKIACEKGGDWARDVGRLHMQLAAASIATNTNSSHVLLLSECEPIPNLFTCRELIARNGNLWLYVVNSEKLRKKLALPVGSCELAVPLNTDRPRPTHTKTQAKREAYATILHSADIYVCGAIVVAHSIRQTGSTRDLVILVDENISFDHRSALEEAGWKVIQIQRIRNPRADPDSYNEWNYSKLRLWQLSKQYDKLIFMDSDVLVLRNIDFLFDLDEISASGNSRTVFNSGVMVVEPQDCTFDLLMSKVTEIVSYNGGDQGFLNEIFTWWHRLPRRMNYLKHFWSTSLEEWTEKTELFSLQPPQQEPGLYVLHYLGLKPWMCFRDYDCNWNVAELRQFASDEAHAAWWNTLETLPPRLQRFCDVSDNRTAALLEEAALADVDEAYTNNSAVAAPIITEIIEHERRHWRHPRPPPPDF